MNEGTADRVVVTSAPEIGLLRQLGEELDRVATPVELMQSTLPICLSLLACASIELTLSEPGEPGAPLTGTLASDASAGVTFTRREVVEPGPPSASDELAAVLLGPGGDEVRLVARALTNEGP